MDVKQSKDSIWKGLEGGKGRGKGKEWGQKRKEGREEGKKTKKLGCSEGRKIKI